MRTNTKVVLFKAPKHTNAHSQMQGKDTHAHKYPILPQMCNSGLREGITHINRRTGQRLMGKLEKTTESSAHRKIKRREEAGRIYIYLFF